MRCEFSGNNNNEANVSEYKSSATLKIYNTPQGISN